MAYSQHKDMIGNIPKSSTEKQPKYSLFSEIEKGDLIVYYATKDYVITGIYEVTSDMEYIPDDPYWNEIFVYSIKEVVSPPSGKYLDFKKLVKESKVNLDMIPNKKQWGIYLQGKTCILLTESDFSIIKEALSNPTFQKSIEKIKITSTKWHKKQKTAVTKLKPTIGKHQKAVLKWKELEEKKFGLLKPDIRINTVDLNEILPKSVWLRENTKYLDGLAKLEMGGQTFYQSILEVQHKGSKEDLCVRVSVVLPFVTRVDIISDEEVLKQIQELLERISDPNIVKSRVKFFSFKEFLS